MRRILTGASLLALGAVFSSCGGPPQLLTGRIRYSWGCTFEMGMTPETTHPACPGGTTDVMGANGENGLNTFCSIRPTAGGTRLRFRIARGGTTLEASEGIGVCGDVVAAGQEMTNGTADLFHSGANSIRNPLQGTCRIRITRLEGSSMAGQMNCEDAHDNAVPYRKLFMRGIDGPPPPGGNGTADRMQAEFSFDNCDTMTSLPPCG